MLEKQKLFSKKRHVFLLSLFISSILSVTGYLFYKKEEKSFKEQRHKELQITAEMKALQLSEWYKDEIFDVEVFYENNLLRKTIIEWLGTKNETTKQILSNQLELIKKSHGYEEILITDPNGKIHINVGDYIPQLDSTTLSFINKVIDTKKIISTDLYFCGNHKQPHIDFIAPVINSSNEAIAVFLFRIDPVNYLYPLLYSWLSETETGDMYIVRKENDSALLLSNSRNNLKTALKFRYSLYDTKYPAVQAVNGKVGFYEGIDLRDKEVLANLNPILGTNWFLITKIDKDEIYSELYFKTGVLIAFITFMILSSALGLMWVYQIRQKNIYKELFIKSLQLYDSPYF